jgi:hypothetical protein
MPAGCKDPSEALQRIGLPAVVAALEAAEAWPDWYFKRLAAGPSPSPSSLSSPSPPVVASQDSGAAFRQCVSKLTDVLAQMEGADQTFHAFKFAALLADGSVQREARFERDLLAEALDKQRRLRRVQPATVAPLVAPSARAGSPSPVSSQADRFRDPPVGSFSRGNSAAAVRTDPMATGLVGPATPAARPTSLPPPQPSEVGFVGFF